MLGGIHETDAMAWIGEKSGTGTHAGEMAAFAFDAQLLLDATLHRHQTDQGFGLVRVELIGDKDPGGLGIGLDGLLDVSGKVCFGACRSDTRRHDLPGGHRQVGNQTLRAMPFVFEFLTLDMTGLHRQAGVQTFQRLDARHFIGTHHMRARRSKRRRGLVDLADRADLLSQFSGVVGWRGEPVPLAMGL